MLFSGLSFILVDSVICNPIFLAVAPFVRSYADNRLTRRVVDYVIAILMGASALRPLLPEWK
jgi:threonine/homoserine/homoserine lactone efflux protein